MGCTNSKEHTNSSKLISNHELTEQFRQYIKQNRTKVDDYLRHQLPLTTNNDYQLLITKSLDLLIEQNDLKNLQKLNHLLQKQFVDISPKKIHQTIDVLKQTADKLQQGQLHFDNDQPDLSLSTSPLNCKTTLTPNTSASIEPGIILKEALEKARVLFYKVKTKAEFNDDDLFSLSLSHLHSKGKQAAIFANPNGGYDVRVIDDNEDALTQDGNLLRSIIVTEVKMCPKQTNLPPTQGHVPSPPPPSTKILDENEIGEDFRRSIDAALKGLEAIYQQPPSTDVNDIQTKSSGAVEHIDNHIELNNKTSAPINSLPSHNVQYTEIIHSESRDGEQSRRFVTESYDDLPTQDDEQTTSLKVVTKSEFSNRPDSGEKIMEQSVQIRTVKVRNETTTTTTSSSTN